MNRSGLPSAFTSPRAIEYVLALPPGKLALGVKPPNVPSRSVAISGGATTFFPDGVRSSTTTGSYPSGGLLCSLQNGAQRLLSRVMSSRSNVQRTRRVSFHGKTSVYEFERQLFGGGGVPDDDAVSLGLGPRLMNSYEGPLQEKDAKDEYGCTGSLAEEDREKLLAEFSSQKAVKRELDTHITPVVLRTQRERAETAVSAEEQRYMPTSEEEAHRVATEDAVVARKYLTTRPLTGAIRKRIGGTRV